VSLVAALEGIKDYEEFDVTLFEVCPLGLHILYRLDFSFAMSDPALPPFTQKSFAPPAPSQSTQAPAKVPGIHYDAAGNPWFCDASGNWVIASTFVYFLVICIYVFDTE
jgi:hypothetical protein